MLIGIGDLMTVRAGGVLSLPAEYLAHLNPDNVALFPIDLTNVVYTKARSSISANAIAAPDGTLTADKLVEDSTAANSHYFYQQMMTVNLTPLAATLWVKAAERSVFRLRVQEAPTATNYSYVDFTLSGSGSASAITTVGASGATASIASYPNGWYRLTLQTQLGGVQVAARVVGYMISGGSINYNGDGASGLYAWGLYVRPGS